MVASIAHERAILSQIELAERRLVQRCNKYDATNLHWKVVDKILAKQVEVTQRMESLTNVEDNDDDMGLDSIVSEFINQNSPKRKSKIDEDLDTNKNVTNDDDEDSSIAEVSVVVK